MQDQYEQIEKYLNGELTDAELTVFENALQTDVALRRLVKLYETGSSALAQQAATETQQATLQTTLEQLGEQYFTTALLEKKPVRLSVRTRRMWQLAAAASILLLAFIGLKWYSYQYYTTEILLAQNYRPTPVPATRSGNDQNLLQPAYQAYRQKNYTEALRIFTAISPENPQYAEAQLFAGYAYFESRQYSQAIQAFASVLQRNDVRYHDNAEWHRLLAALAGNDTNSNTYLSAILTNPQHTYYKEAQRLQKQLKSWLRRLSK